MPSGFLGRGVGPSAFGGGGLAAPVPVAGSELLTNVNFETGNPPTGWSAINGSTLARVADPRPGSAGSYALEATRGTGDGVTGQAIVGVAVGTWLQQTAWARCVTATSAYMYIYGFINSGTMSATTWTQIVCCERSPNLNFTNNLRVSGGGGVARFDDFSIVPLTLSSLLSTRAYASADCDLSVAVTRTAGTQAGFAVRVDDPANPQNFIISYLDGASGIKTDKCLAGVYSNIAGLSGAVTYVAGQRPRIVCSGNNVSVYYNGVQVGSTTAVADAAITGNKNHGLFSTYAANTFSGYTAA